MENKRQYDKKTSNENIIYNKKVTFSMAVRANLDMTLQACQVYAMYRNKRNHLK